MQRRADQFICFTALFAAFWVCLGCGLFVCWHLWVGLSLRNWIQLRKPTGSSECRFMRSIQIRRWTIEVERFCRTREVPTGEDHYPCRLRNRILRRPCLWNNYARKICKLSSIRSVYALIGFAWMICHLHVCLKSCVVFAIAQSQSNSIASFAEYSNYSQAQCPICAMFFTFGWCFTTCSMLQCSRFWVSNEHACDARWEGLG